jgi:Zn-dependent peptidase ImmA (M78 family)/transcriptional regulator with XRE-family HTH domain
MMNEEIAINSDVLKHVMAASGYDSTELAKKINVSKEDVDGWLAGDRKPTITKLKDISKATKYNLAALLLEEVPTNLPKPKDYRTANKAHAFSRKTLSAIRKARDIQSLYKELGGQSEAQKISLNKYAMSHSPESAAEKERGLLAVATSNTSGEAGARELLKKYVKVLEQNDILVLQLQMPIEDCRGFSIKDKSPFIIALSSSDQIYPRLFTLFHEYAHLLLQSEGGSMCIPEEDMLSVESGDLGRIETWCNKFSASFLLPENKIRKSQEVSALSNLIKTSGSNYEIYKAIKSVSGRYRVSYLAFVIRLRGLNLIPEAKYNIIKQEYYSYSKREEAAEKAKKKKGGAPKPEYRVVSRNGEKFSTLVVRSLKAGKIDYYDAVEYLGTNIKNVDKLAAKLG